MENKIKIKTIRQSFWQMLGERKKLKLKKEKSEEDQERKVQICKIFFKK